MIESDFVVVMKVVSPDVSFRSIRSRVAPEGVKLMSTGRTPFPDSAARDCSLNTAKERIESDFVVIMKVVAPDAS
jgi:hypothetical protein